jgi:hypothetical protein
MRHSPGPTAVLCISVIGCQTRPMGLRWFPMFQSRIGPRVTVDGASASCWARSALIGSSSVMACAGSASRNCQGTEVTVTYGPPYRSRRAGSRRSRFVCIRYPTSGPRRVRADDRDRAPREAALHSLDGAQNWSDHVAELGQDEMQPGRPQARLNRRSLDELAPLLPELLLLVLRVRALQGVMCSAVTSGESWGPRCGWTRRTTPISLAPLPLLGQRLPA